MRLTKADLVQLMRLSMVPDQDITRISTHVEDGDIQDSTLDAFLAHEELPAILDNLHILCKAARRDITVDLGGIFNSLSVTGDDEVWVRGSYDRLREVLLRHRRRETPHMLRSTLVGSLLAGAVLTLVNQLLIQGELLYGFLAGVAGAFLLMRYIGWAIFSIAQPARIVLTAAPAPWRTLFNRDNLGIAVAILALIFTIIQTVR